MRIPARITITFRPMCPPLVMDTFANFMSAMTASQGVQCHRAPARKSRNLLAQSSWCGILFGRCLVTRLQHQIFLMSGSFVARSSDDEMMSWRSCRDPLCAMFGDEHWHAVRLEQGFLGAAEQAAQLARYHAAVNKRTNLRATPYEKHLAKLSKQRK